MKEGTQDKDGNKSKIEIPVRKNRKAAIIKSGEKFTILLKKEVFDFSV